MKTLVIDTSVLIKWLNQNNEQHLKNADKILQDVKTGQAKLVAPELIKYEIGNVLLKSKLLIPKQAAVPLSTVFSLPITFVHETKELAESSYQISHELNITYYDAAFLSVAKQFDAVLVTDNIKHQGKGKNIKVISLDKYF